MPLYSATQIKKAMGIPDFGPKKLKQEKLKEKYKTEQLLRPSNRDDVKPTYNTTPGDKFSPKKHPGKKDLHRDRERQGDDSSTQFDYIRNNLCIKTCICNRDVLRFQVKKVTIRNYTPKILNQEVNMGMWM